MADFSKTSYAQQTNPAAPEGLQQTAANRQAQVDRGDAPASRFSGMSYVQDAKQWFGGRNTEGTNSGWSNTIMAQGYEDYQNWLGKVAESRKSKNPGDWLSSYDWLNPEKNPNATGIAFWDDPEKRFKRGDVVRNGRAQIGQNIYDVYDEDTANLMMAPYLFSASEQARFNRDSQPTERYNREVSAKIDEWTENARSAESQIEYQARVFQERADLLEGHGFETVATAGGAAGAAAIASPLLAFGPVGWAAWGLATVAGGVAANLNQDAIADAFARGQVQADMAKEKYGSASWFTTQLTTYGGVTQKLISPFSNMVQGGYDAMGEGGVGDGTARFHEYDQEGRRIANGWVQALDVGATVADGFAQFTSAPGQIAYLGTMGLTVAGKSGSLLATGGLPGGEGSAVFNEYKGQWDEAVGKEFAAALGSVAIDAVQMGVGAAVGKASQASRAAFGAGAPEAKVAANRADEVINGFRFKFDQESGEVISKHATATLLAPSEMVQWIATSWRARNLARMSEASGQRSALGGWHASEANRWIPESTRKFVDDAVGTHMPSPDDYYRAALEMTTQSSLRSAMLNGFAEGWEEVIQGIFDPISVGEAIRPEEVIRAGVYGWASGAGMGLGGRTVSPQAKQEARAKTSYLLMNRLSNIEDDKWREIYWGRGVTDADRKSLAILGEKEARTVQKHLKVYERQQQRAQMGSVLGVAAVDRARAEQWEKMFKSLNPAIDGMQVVMGRGPRIRAVNGQVEAKSFQEDAGVTSFKQAMINLGNVRKGLQLQQESLQRDLERWTAEQSRREPGSDALAVADQKVAELTKNLQSFPRQMELADLVRSQFDGMYEAWFESTDPVQKQKIIDTVNLILSKAFDRNLQLRDRDGNAIPLTAEDQELIRRAVEQRTARYPTIDSGSYAAVLRPQVSSLLSEIGQEATVYVHQSYLKPLNADHDGDQVVVLNAMYLGDDELNQLRRGAAFLTTKITVDQVDKLDEQGNKVLDKDGNPVKVTTKQQRWTVLTDPADSHEARVDIVTDALGLKAGSPRRRIVEKALDQFEDRFRKRYVNDNHIFDLEVMDEILAKHRRDVSGRVYESEEIFLEAIWNGGLPESSRVMPNATEDLLLLADRTNVAELSWMKGAIDDFWHSVHRKLAMNAAGNQKPESSGEPQVLPEETVLQEGLAMEEAATSGMTLSTIMQYTTDPMRQVGGLNYFPFFRSAIDVGDGVVQGDFSSDLVKAYVDKFHQFATGTTESSLEKAEDKNPIETRVLRWLNGFVSDMRAAHPEVEAFRYQHDAVVLLSQLAVPYVQVTGVNEYTVHDHTTTLLQALLAKSIEVEKNRQRNTSKDDPIHKRIQRLERLTSAEGDHSTTANRALMAIFEHTQLYALTGPQSDGMGGHLTPNQFKKMLLALSDEQREELGNKWRRLPAYLDPFQSRTDPPYVMDMYTTGRYNAFTMVVNAIIAEASYEIRDMKDKGETASTQFKKFLGELKTARKKWYDLHFERLRDESQARNEKEIPPAAVLEDMLRENPQMAQMIATKLPTSATTAIFEIEDGMVYPARWLLDALVMEDVAKAELSILINGAIADLRSMDGRIQHDIEWNKERERLKKEGAKEEDIPPPRRIAEINASQIKSRISQTLYKVMENDQTGMEMNRFLGMALDKGSIQEFYDAVNAEPAWIGDRQKLIPYFDDVDTFEESPKDVWNTGGTASSMMREALELDSARMARISKTFAERDAALKSQSVLLNHMRNALKNASETSDINVSERIRQLKRLLTNAAMMPDSAGAAGVDQALEAVQKGLPALHNKGLPEPQSVILGITTMTDGFGARSNLMQELDAQTSLDGKAVQTNLSGLTKNGAHRIHIEGGREIEVDFSLTGDEAHDRGVLLQVVDLLDNPSTRDFMLNVLIPTARDVDANNEIRNYSYISTAKSDELGITLEQALTDSTLLHLFPSEKLARLDYDQAIQLSGMMQAAARQKALGKSAEERDKADFPIHRIFNEFLVYYMSGDNRASVDLAQERKAVVRDVMSALQWLALLDPQARPTVKKLLQESLKEKYGRQKGAWERLNLDAVEVDFLDIEMTKAIRTDLQAKIDRITTQIGNLPLSATQQQHDDLLMEQLELEEKLAQTTKQQPLWKRMEHMAPDVVGAINMWTNGVNDRGNGSQEDLERMAEIRLSILDHLLQGENVNFLVEKGRGDLVRKVRSALDNDPKELVRPGKIKDDDWTYLGHAAATTMVIKAGSVSSFGVGINVLKPLGEKGEIEAIHRYYDVTRAGVLDLLLDDQLIDLMGDFQNIAGAKPQGVDFKQVAEAIDNSLFNERKIGRWTPLDVTEHMKADKMVKQASSLPALQRAGIAPPEDRDLVGAMLVTFEKPQGYADNTSPEFLEHHTTLSHKVQATVEQPGNFMAGLDPYVYFNLEHHFAKRIEVVGPNGDRFDLFDVAGDLYIKNDDVKKSGYRLFRGDKLQAAFEELQRLHGEGTYTVEVDYVDVDKKPFNPQYVNSIYFDGAGPAGTTSTSPGSVAEFIFGTGQYSKVTQQGPLDFAKGAGTAFWQMLTTRYDDVKRGESRKVPLREIIQAKAAHMWGLEYEGGHLPLGANNALYKWMKQRHIVTGLDANGNFVRLWAEDVISKQTQNLAKGRQLNDGIGIEGDYTLFALSETEHLTLLGRSGIMGSEQALTLPVLNVQDIETFPSLDNERLRQLGLADLGKKGSLTNSLFGRQVPWPPATSQLEGRGKEFKDHRDFKFRTWQGESEVIIGNRFELKKLLNLRGPDGSRQRNKSLLRAKTNDEMSAAIMARLGPNFPGGRDMGQLAMSDYFEKNLDEMMGGNPEAVLWVYDQEMTYSPEIATFGRASLDNIRSLSVGGKKTHPTYGDVVAIDLDSQMKMLQSGSGKNYSQILEETKLTIRVLSDLGVGLGFMGNASHKLRSDIAMWIREGEVGYYMLEGSSHYAMPSRVDSVLSKNERALNRSLSEVKFVTPKWASYIFRTADLQISEGTAYFDYENADQVEFPRIVTPIVPATLTQATAAKRAAWGLPIQAEGLRNSWEYTINRLLPQLEKQEVVDHLKLQTGGKDGNPPGIPLARINIKGEIDYGVLSFDDAMKRFIGKLRSGTPPIGRNQTLYPGDFYVVLSSKSEPMLMRYGFEVPDADVIQDQMSAPLGTVRPETGKSGIGIAVALAKLEDMQTVPPPITIRDMWGADGLDGGQEMGILIEAEYATSAMSKLLLEQIGGKLGLSPMPEDWAFPVKPMGTNGTRITIGMPPDTLDDKQATNGSLIDFRELFVLTGIDFRRDMVKFIYGDRPRTDEEYDADYARVEVLLNAWADREWGATESEIESLLDPGGALNFFQEFLNGYGQALLGDQWSDINVIDPFTQFQQDPVQRIGSAILCTLMLPGVRPEHVIATQGMLTVENRQGNSKITQMPPMLTRALGNHRYPDTRKEILRRANANAKWPTSQTDKGAVPQYYVAPDLTFWVRIVDPRTGKEMLTPGTLQRVTALPFERDAAGLAASQLKMKSDVSPHVTAVSAGAIGARAAVRPTKKGTDAEGNLVPLPTDMEALFGDNYVERFDEDKPTSTLHEIFARTRRHLETYSPWESRLPMQETYLMDSRDIRVSYVKPIEGSPANPNRTFSQQAENDAVEFLGKLNLGRESLYEVDILVRQFVGRRGSKKTEDDDVIDEDVYRQVVSLMTDNVKNKMHPLHGGAVPMEMESFWAKVFDAQRGKPNPWIPVAKEAWKKTEYAPDTWEGWVDTLIGQVIHSQSPFHGMYRMDLDGMFHTYMGTTSTYVHMPLSMDTQRDLMLMDPDTNQYYLSLDPGMRAVLSSPVLLDNRRHNLDTLTGHNTDLIRPYDADVTPMSTIAEQITRQKRWLETNKIARQKRTSVMKYYQDGLTYRQSTQNTTNWIRALNHLQIINRLANPGLFFSALMEVPYRNMTEHLTNLASGNQMSRGGVLTSRAASGINKLAGKAGAEGPVLQTKYSPEQIKKLRQLAANMGSKTEWRAELFHELLYVDIQHGSNPNKLGRGLENVAANVARVTGDPRLGMTAKSAAMRYNEAALEYLMQVDANITVDQYIENMSRDPLWLQKQSASLMGGRVNAHSVGINRVARVRGTRQSAINKQMFGWIDKLENGDTVGKQFAGFLLNVPFRFKRFNVGTFLTITGLDGFDQMFAMMRDKRPDKGVIGRLQAAMRGEEYRPEGFTDFSDVLEGVDLTRPLVRGGLQQTMLLAAGLWAGSLGLDGEDEEDKRRRRMAKYLDAAYLYDPREMENDFLYADALFLDGVPFFDQVFENPDTGRSVVQPHWILKQFLSPVMGIQRFMNTGDIREVGWGFWEANAAIPYSVTHTFEQAKEAADLLTLQAKDTELEKGETETAADNISRLFLSVASVYERALLENQTVNAVRSAFDEFDRDPYVEVKRNETGEIIFENGLPVRSDSLQSYREEGEGGAVGEIKQGYEKRSDISARMHAYAENNATFSVLASLFTGQFNPGSSSFKRSNMAVKEQKVELPTSSQAEAEALILLAFQNRGGQPQLTKEEIIHLVKQRYQDAGITWDQRQVEQEAQEIYSANTDERAAFSLLDPEGNEIIAQAGAGSVFEGLRSGNLRWDDAVLDGIVIPWEMRDKIASEWVDELIQEGVDMGMTEEKAYYYARRVYWGDSMDPTSVGLRDILYDDRIPGSGTVKYNQLNMTYMIGPDGKPWATPFSKNGVLAAFGVPLPAREPANGPGMSKDARGKSVDEVLGINLGLHGLVRKTESPYEPPDPFEEAAKKTYTPTDYSRYSGRGYRRGGGGGGGGGYTPLMDRLPRGTSPDLDRVPMINTSNPYIRRAYVNRQRITSERERLKQWQ